MARRRLWVRLHTPVNVLDYGADPTGKADSTKAIRAALHAADQQVRWLPRWLWLPQWARRIVSARRTAYLAPGTFLVRGIDIPRGTTLKGGNNDQDRLHRPRYRP
jgi:hypothetical protein